MRVLVVDDSESMRRLLRAVAGCREWMIFGKADNGLAGVRQFQELKPDLVLIDLVLPGMNGIDDVRHMSSLDPTVPLILFGVLNVEELQDPARQAGICQVVSKAQVWDLIRSMENAMTHYQGKNRQTPEIRD
jgi:DNA-binding NarL/FixJ family response regulator